jgi:hypothetical protein
LISVPILRAGRSTVTSGSGKGASRASAVPFPYERLSHRSCRNWDPFAKRLGLTGEELPEQLETGGVREEHWPAILKAEKLALRYVEEPTLMWEKMQRHGIGVVDKDDPAGTA